MTKPFRWEDMCMSDDPFAGDLGGGGGGDHVLTDKMVTNRRGGTCHTCAGECAPSSRNRVRTEVYDGEMMSFRWCQTCCFGMAIAGLGRDNFIEARIRIGDERRGGQQ